MSILGGDQELVIDLVVGEWVSGVVWCVNLCLQSEFDLSYN